MHKDPERLREGHDHLRRAHFCVGIGLTLLFVLLGVIGWWTTGDMDQFYAGVFGVAVVLPMTCFNCFVMLNPWRDPAATHRLMEERARKNVRYGRKVTFLNGLLFVLACPFVVLAGIAEDGANGFGNVVFWGLVGVAGLLAGLFMIAWSRRRTRHIL